ncbi:galactose oxidase-like domain-containing protein [Meiothermus granaticius]|uniref:Fibronectin type-III domain-containing protein n=1 Tax=Meiothermus granaticius NBRC 107808 TaxID=1227551 RepID=A0A399FBU7_9DEIN|nr:galactose oxidase-like domain-containing protein [Meiothermus granaticius]RIH92151.1 hypothetical protein Mgrana_01930 [Meiothermus granaticius NBRC 107808]
MKHSTMAMGLGLMLTLMACTQNPVSVPTPPLPDPASVTVAAKLPTLVTVSWSTVPGASGYLLERRSDTGSYVQIAEPTTPSFTDLSVSGGVRYTYRVKAKSSNALSGGKESNPVTPPTLCSVASSSPSTKGCFGEVFDWLRTSALEDGQTRGVVPTHIGLLPDGRLMTYFGLDPQGQFARDNYKVLSQHNHSVTVLWDPAKGSGQDSFQRVDNLHTDLFCSGHVLGPDGRYYTSGGNLGQSTSANGATPNSNPGSNHTDIFDPTTNTWSAGPDMADGRWYPTMITLSSGELLMVGGNSADDKGDSNGVGAVVDTPNILPEVWDTVAGVIRPLSNATTDAASATFKYANNNQPAYGYYWHYYPWIFQDPFKDKQAFMAGSANTIGYLDTTGSGAWSAVSNRSLGSTLDVWRTYGTAVMYQPGKILVIGGGGAVTGANSTVRITLSGGTSYTVDPGPNMAYQRTHLMATLLADGQIFVNGGNTDGQNYVITHAVYESELIDPNEPNPTFRRAAMAQRPRIYHSASVLLPDATVLTAGGGGCGDSCDRFQPEANADPNHPGLTVNQPNGEIYYPPYLFNPDGSPATRPVIVAAPSAVNYGQSFTLQTDQPAENIARVTFLKLGSATHAFNMGQLFNELQITARSGNQLTVVAPASGRLAPPGYYMLFVLNSSGVPSAAKMVKIGGGP